jgi:hypothetical protein
MSKIDLSIWGIRDGFQQGGFFHTHDIDAVKEIQKDRFRSVKNVIGREGFFMMHRKGGKYIVTYCETNIKEYNPNAKRGAYVSFSLIIDENYAFKTSPREVLKALAEFYVGRVGDSNTNNFEKEDLLPFLSKIQIEPKTSFKPIVQGNFYLYYTDQNQIDNLLIGKLSFVNLSELVLVPNSEYDPKTNTLREINFYDDSYGAAPSYFDYSEEKKKFEQAESTRVEKEQEEIRRREEERKQKEEEVKQARILENQIAIYLNQNRLDEAIKLYKETTAAIQAKISTQVTNDLRLRNQKREQEDGIKKKQQEDRDTISKIDNYLKTSDFENAAIFYLKLHDKNNTELAQEKREQIRDYNTQKLEEEARIKREEAEKKKKKEEKKARRNKIIVSVLGVLTISFIVSFFTAVPAFMWDSDGDGYHNILDDNCPEKYGTKDGCPDSDGDGIIDKEDECPKLPGDLNGCPDQDGDGVADRKDNCDTIPGTIQNNGCPEKPDTTQTTDDLTAYNVAPQVESDKLMTGKAVKTPSDGLFQGQNIGLKWLKFKNQSYEFSTNESKGYQPVKSQETVDLLNKYYGLKGVLKQSGTNTTTTGNKTNPKTTSPTNVQTPPTNPPKPPQGKGLTQAEEKELNDLQVKEASSTLTGQERERKKTLERKKL